MNPDRQDADFLKTLTLLYVEDDEAAREQTRIFLERRAGRVITASNGAEGLESFQRNQPDLVVTDVLMPVLDGLGMGQKIRELGSKVPIIITTAFEQTEYCMRSIDIQVDKYILKPIQTGQLDAALRDIAHRLRAEDQLKRQQRLDERERMIQHEEAMGILAGGMAHDYNNLLQSLLSSVSLAKLYSEPGSKVQAVLAVTEQCWDQARELGEQLIILAQAAEGLERLGQIKPHLVTSAQAAHKNSNITLEMQLPDDLPELRFNESRLLMVFSNLVANALEAMPEGGKLVIAGEVAELEEPDDLSFLPGRYVHISFADSGGGIPPEHLPRIFAPYFTTKERFSQKGAGLGLALCRAIIQTHRGAIRAESRPGEGSTFHIYLPVPAT